MTTDSSLSRITWKTLRDGTVELKQGDVSWIPYLSVAAEAELRDHILVPRKNLFHENSQRTQVPFSWGTAICWVESRGNERALRKEPKGPNGAGLFQPTSEKLRRGHTDEELFNPVLNAEIGFDFLAFIIKLERGRVGVVELVNVAATYNHGSVVPTSANEWGLEVARPVYLMNVVMANNTTVRATGATDPSFEPPDRAAIEAAQIEASKIGTQAQILDDEEKNNA